MNCMIISIIINVLTGQAHFDVFSVGLDCDL